MTCSTKTIHNKSSRLYIQKRNISYVGLRDLPEHLINGISKSQLTPIFSIYEKNVIEAFEAQLKGEVQDYMKLLKLKTKFSSSKLGIRADPSPEAFGWIEDMNLLQQLPEEFALLRTTLDEELKKYAPKFLQQAVNRLQTNAALLNTFGISINLDAESQRALTGLK